MGLMKLLTENCVFFPLFLEESFIILVLRNVPGDVMEVFDMTGLADLLTFE